MACESFVPLVLSRVAGMFLWRRLDYTSPEIRRGELYTRKEQDRWAYGVVAHILIVSDCPFVTAAEALDARCARRVRVSSRATRSYVVRW